jgi:hypothetical protein
MRVQGLDKLPYDWTGPWIERRHQSVLVSAVLKERQADVRYPEERGRALQGEGRTGAR